MRWFLLFSTCAVAAILAACGAVSKNDSDASAQPANCPFIDASSCQQPVPSYASDIQPMLDRACNSTCHAPGVGPWPLTNYPDIADWGSVIGGDVAQCTMPPAPLDDGGAGAGNGVLTLQERTALLDWLACGAPAN